MRMLVGTRKAFSFVAEPKFHQMMRDANPRLKVKSPSTFARMKLPILYANTKEAIEIMLEKELPTTELMAFTSDFWKARNLQQFFNVTIHYITTDFELRHFCIGFLGNCND